MINNKSLNDFDLPVDKSSSVISRLNSFKTAFGETIKLSLFNNDNIFSLGRDIEPVNIDFENVICTTYFTSKADPQQKEKVESNNIGYIAPWYDSMRALKLTGIVFYDNLSKEFVEKYQTENILFLRCTLGDYSLNDERFIIYYMFFLKNKVKNILLTDGNDVIINKAPFEFFQSKKGSTIFIGRGKENKILHSKWNLSSIDRLSKGLNVDIPNDFYEMAIYNAGIIGGNYYVVMYFLRQICFVFFKIDNAKNNNMGAMHYVLYYYFFPNCRKLPQSWFYNLTDKNLKLRILKKIKDLKMDFLIKGSINYENDNIALSNHIYSGFPLNSRFYLFEINSEAFLIHK